MECIFQAGKRIQLEQGLLPALPFMFQKP